MGTGDEPAPIPRLYGDRMDEEGGEAACYLPHVDAAGKIPDLRSRITFGAEGLDLGARFPGLVPLPGETVTGYRERLESPVARTDAWRLVLLAEDREVALALPGDAASTFSSALLDYLQQLVG
jgi:hypothetical protein